jgi:hypothetical protein
VNSFDQKTTNMTIHKNFILFLASMLTLASAQAFAQEVRQPKNAIGIFAGVEWNTISGLTGIEYERVVHTMGNIELGVKGAYIFSHQNGNMQWLNSSQGGTTSTGMLIATTHYFTGSKKDRHKGFFLYGGLGLGQRTTMYDRTKHVTQIPAIDMGLGWRFSPSDKAAVSLTTGITFAGEGGITLTRISVNF